MFILGRKVIIDQNTTLSKDTVTRLMAETRFIHSLEHLTLQIELF
jgi:hypothetical protein